MFTEQSRSAVMTVNDMVMVVKIAEGRCSSQNMTSSTSTSTNQQQCPDQCDDQQMQFLMTTETVRAVDAVKFIAAHLRTEDDYAEV